MTLLEQFTNLAALYLGAQNTADRMIALYKLRTFLDETDQLSLFCSIEVTLHLLGQRLPDRYKDRVRAQGFQFPEDLDNAIELLCDQKEEPDGFL